MRYSENILELIGKTPLVKINRLAKTHGIKATILAKMESLNPGYSVKDRIGISMIEAARGRIGAKRARVAKIGEGGETTIARQPEPRTRADEIPPGKHVRRIAPPAKRSTGPREILIAIGRQCQDGAGCGIGPPVEYDQAHVTRYENEEADRQNGT